MWTVRILSTSNEQERALRATADAHERRFSALIERSPVPTLLSERGMRLAHVNDAFCTLVGRRAEQLLGIGWIETVHTDDLDAVIEEVSAALDGEEVCVDTGMVTRDGRGMASVASLGVRLTADDVAAAAQRVVHERLPLPRSPHRTVGRQARVLACASAVSPDWVRRLVVARLAR